MAHQESEREDLLKDATAYSLRGQWRVPSCQEPVFVGFRPNGGASFYFGQDEAYHFNAAGELRRAFYDGKLIKAEDAGLVELTRHRTPGETQLLRREWSADACQAFLAQIRKRLNEFSHDLSGDSAILEGQVVGSTAKVAAESAQEPPSDLAEYVIRWIEQSFSGRIALRPNA